MEHTEKGKKLILAIIQEADYDMVVSALTEHSFYVTQLSSTGGFLRKRNVTIMIGVEVEQLEMVLQILKECAGHRKEVVYTMTGGGHTAHGAGTAPAIPIQVDTGGTTVFVMDLDSLEKY